MTAFRFVSGFLLVLLSAMPAQAGFEWTPPPAPMPQIQGDGPLMPSVPAVDVQVIAPVGVPLPPPVVEGVPVPQAPAMQETVFAEAIGFGSDMPLVLALRQVVPPRYAFAFDPSVDQGARVSWNGGKPWNLVLEDALRPLGLGAQITESAVHVVPLSQMPVAMPAPVIVEKPAPAMAAPLQVAPAQDVPARPDPVREIYIRRHGHGGETSQIGNGMNEALNPAAGGSGARALQAPLLTAPAGSDYKEALMQPVSLSDGNEAHLSPAVVKTAKRQGVMDPYDVRFWEAEKGGSLKNTLATWSSVAGVELYWVSTQDYILPEAVQLHGNYTEALTQILGVYGEGEGRPQGRLHPNLPTGPSVLIIEAAQN